jgi:hypothetical protein
VGPLDHTFDMASPTCLLATLMKLTIVKNLEFIEYLNNPFDCKAL